MEEFYKELLLKPYLINAKIDMYDWYFNIKIIQNWYLLIILSFKNVISFKIALEI